MTDLTKLKIGDELYYRSYQGYNCRVLKITGETKKYWLCALNDVYNLRVKKIDGYVEKYVYAVPFEGELKEKYLWEQWKENTRSFCIDTCKLTKENKEEIDTFIKKYGKEVKI